MGSVTACIIAFDVAFLQWFQLPAQRRPFSQKLRNCGSEVIKLLVKMRDDKDIAKQHQRCTSWSQ